jgi:tRNA dimethylallyltransferase
VPHHLIDVLEPWEEFNVVVFQQKCKECMEEIYERGHIPILTGGTGFYIQAVLRDIDFTANEENTRYRTYLEELAGEKGAEYLHQMLTEVDPEGAAAIHANNVKRTIRALEFYHLTGEKISDHNQREAQKDNAYNACYFVLNDDRSLLYQRIEQRVDEMIANDPLNYRTLTNPMRAFYDKWEENGMADWNFKKIITPEEDDVIDILMVGNSFCYYYVEELAGIAAAAGVKMRVCNVYYSGCKMSQHYNW